MTFFQLLVRNLFYHWRGNVAVFLGIVLGSAVLTGALLVGDSLRGSLKALTLSRLGWVEDAMTPGRFFREQLAREVSAGKRAPVLMLQGSASFSGDEKRVGRVNVFGVDASFWPDRNSAGDIDWSSGDADVVINSSLASALGASIGSMLRLNVQAGSAAPGETLMGKRKAGDVIQPVTVKVRRVVIDEGIGSFSLKPTPEPVRNVFVPLRFLQQKLELAGEINAILVADAKPSLSADLQKQLKLDDWGLRYRSPADRAEAFFRMLAKKPGEVQIPQKNWRDKLGKPFVNRVPDALVETALKNGGVLKKDDVVEYYKQHRDYHVLASRRILLEPRVVEAIESLVPERHDLDKVPRWRITPLLIYLADTISDGKAEVPYSIIASDDRRVLTKDGKEKYALADDQVLLTTWPGSPLQAKPGSALTVSYYVPDEKNQLQLTSEKFIVQAVEKIEGVLDDPDLVPEVPGVTDKLDVTNWVNPPFPYDPSRNKTADIAFSKRYRTTPRAYINLKRAQELWKNRFGALTSIQVHAKGGRELPETLPDAFLRALKPEQGGFVFQPVRESAVAASAGTTDFGEYFLYFSFFLIVSSLLLVGLLVRLNIDRRAAEIGLLLAIGWAPSRVVFLLLGEGVVIAAIGSGVGLAGALWYADLMLKMLSANWPGGANLDFLRLHAEPMSLFIGYSASLLVSVVTLWWATRVLGDLPPRSLLSGETTQASGLDDSELGWSRWLVPIGLVGAMALAISARFVASTEGQAGCFFGGGALLLMACLAGAWNGLKLLGQASSPQPTLTGLGMRNAGRHLVRSVLTVGLLGAASFLIVAVESFHADTDKSFHLKTGGSGGFTLVAEGNLPIFEDLNNPKVRDAYRLDTAALAKVVVHPCRVQPGDDASCLNLYKPLKPRVVSFSTALIERGGFDFAASLAQSAEEKANPWLQLKQTGDDAIPAIIDANTADWTLKTPLGSIVEVNDAEGKPCKLRIVGLLNASIFQSEIIVGEKAFLSLYPQQTGYSFLLIDTGEPDPAKLKTIEQDLGKGLEAFNMDVQTTAERIRGYLAVRNMYLATFQALGGLGLVLGAVGLAIVLLRGVWERRAELALLQALGFRSGQLAWLVLVENVFLLVCGLAAGTASALLAVAPYLTGAGAASLWSRIGLLLALVAGTGLISAILAVWSTLQTPVLTALRRE